jgi:hypothetical protein
VTGGVPAHIRVVDEFIVDVEVAGRHDLVEGLAVEVDLVEGGVFLVVDVGVCEAESVRNYPFEMMSPFEDCCRYLLRFTPWIRIMSPHFSMFWPSPGIYLNKL